MTSGPGAADSAPPRRDGSYDEALDRFHLTGPEFDGWLSNHGPMVVEVLSRRGAGTQIHAWTDRYAARLDDPPRGIHPIAPEAWRDPLGDPTRTGDWIALMLREVEQRPWPDTLAIWWPRLLPGIAAGATHGVIRVGHVVQALRDEVTTPRLTELAEALAYWAARWQPVPVTGARGTLSASEAIDGIPAVPDPRFGIRHRLAQLPDLPGWASAQSALAPPVDPVVALDAIVDAAVSAYGHLAHGQPTMLVHAVTAPAAVARVVPSLPASMARPAVETAWAATAAVLAAYRPDTPRPPLDPGDRTADEVWEQAVTHGGEHVLKLADTALENAAPTTLADGRAAALTAISLDA